MVFYQVSITLEPAIEDEWLDWMRQVHVPDVLKTGCFTRCTLARLVEPAGERVTFVFRYDAPSWEAYERYRTQFAPALQQDHTARYAGRFQGSRQVLEELATFVAE
jgi:hypothetical protein